MILALDPSSTATGYALFRDSRLLKYGTVRRKKNDTVYAYACSVAGRICCAVSITEGFRVVYEINDTPLPRARQKSMRKAMQATGRILQALGVEGEPMQADRKKKSQKRTHS